MLLDALVYGIIASSALVIGGAIGSVWQAPIRLTGILLAFASGSLISALSFELFPDAVELGGLWPAGAGLLLGAFIFVVVNTWLDRWVAGQGTEREDQRQTVKEAARGEGAAADPPEGAGSAAGVGLALLAAVTLDGVPENLALGFSLSEEASLTLMVAIFASNLPEALVGSIAMRRGGRSRPFVIGLWSAAALLLTLAVVVGRFALTGMSPHLMVWPLSIAGGAVLASLADTLMPEAFEHGQPLNAYATVLGFFLSFALATA